MQRSALVPDVLSGGQDAFLDVVANLVGILVILITVIGVGMRDVDVTPTVDVKELTDPLLPDVETPRDTMDSLHADLGRLGREIGVVTSSVRSKRAERDDLQARLAMVRLAVKSKQDGLDDQQRRSFELLQAVEQARGEREQLRSRRSALRHEEVGPRILEHRATPLAETVFGSEEHFRLLNGRLVYVPLNELVDRLREDAEQNAWQVKESSDLTKTIGPVDGFYLRYTLAVGSQSAVTPNGPVSRRVVTLDRFVLVPVSDSIGKPLDDELSEESDLNYHLRGFDPVNTTITVWTYPDSYAEFRRLREWLHARGYQAAGRPLPAGQPIMGSPDGTRSAAQ